MAQARAIAVEMPESSVTAVVSGTFLFADVRGFTRMTSTHGDAHTLAQMTRFYRLVDAAVMQNRGVVDNHIGDEVMVHFGISDEQENQVDRAIATAIDIQRRISLEQLFTSKRGSTPLTVGIGIATGSVAVGMLGDDHKHKIICIGDAVNVASRLTDIACPGQILINEVAFDQASSRHAISLLRPIALRGRNKMVSAYEVFTKDGII